jgi:hypothetical protein
LEAALKSTGCRVWLTMVDPAKGPSDQKALS